MHAWDCPCGTRNAPSFPACRNCRRPAGQGSPVGSQPAGPRPAPPPPNLRRPTPAPQPPPSAPRGVFRSALILQVESGAHAGEGWRLVTGGTIGKRQDNDVCLRHTAGCPWAAASLEWDPQSGRWVISPAGDSGRKVLVNRQPLTSPRSVSQADTLSIGTTVLRVTVQALGDEREWPSFNGIRGWECHCGTRHPTGATRCFACGQPTSIRRLLYDAATQERHMQTKVRIGFAVAVVFFLLFSLFSWSNDKAERERAEFQQRYAVPAATGSPSYSGSGYPSGGSYRPPDGSPHSVHVRGYYRRDGTYVRPHSRRGPR